MPSYVANYTPRSRIRYRAAGLEHTIQFRGPRGANGAAMNSEFKALAATIFGQLATDGRLADDFEWLAHDIALTDEDTFAPGELPATVTGTVDVATFTAIQKIRSLSFSGRTAGSRARCYLYGALWLTDDTANLAKDGIITALEYAGVATIASELTNHAKAGNGVSAIWYPRGLVKDNDFLLRLVRRGFITGA